MDGGQFFSGTVPDAPEFDFTVWLAWVDDNLHREAAAHALTRALVDCAPSDRIPFLETMLDTLRAGAPSVGFGGIMSEAREWAAWACRSELKAWAVACYDEMSPRDQAAFRRHLDRGQRRGAA